MQLRHDNAMSAFQRRLTPGQAFSRMADACARAEICSADAAARLRRRGLSADDIGQIVDRLVEEGFIDDERYARAFVRDKYRFAGWGRRKIALALAAKRIPRDIAAEALDTAVDEEEYRARLIRLLRSKARSLPAELHDTFEGRQKLYAFAAGRGFESSLISSIISSDNEPIWPDEDCDE